MTTARKVIVVGGGLAGVTCAVTLAEAGVDVVLLEAAQRLGGRFATVGRWVFEHRVEPPGEHRVEPPGEHLVKQWDLPLEHGIHGVWRQYKNLRRLLLTYGLDGALLPAGDQSMLMTGLDGRPALVPIGDVVRESLAPDVFAQPMVLKDPTLREAALAFGPRALFQVALDLSHAVAFQGSRADISRYDHLSVKDLTSKWPPILRRLFSTLTHAAFFREAEDVSLAAFFSGLESYVLPRKGDSAFELFRLCSEAAVFGPLHQVIEGRGSKVRLCSAVSALTFDGDRALGVRLSSGLCEGCRSAREPAPLGRGRRRGLRRLVLARPSAGRLRTLCSRNGVLGHRVPCLWTPRLRRGQRGRRLGRASFCVDGRARLPRADGPPRPGARPAERRDARHVSERHVCQAAPRAVGRRQRLDVRRLDRRARQRLVP